MNKDKIVDDAALLASVKEYDRTLTYDFSNYYFKVNIWKKDYIAKFGDLPKALKESSSKKVAIYVNAETGEEFKDLPSSGRVVTVARNHENYYKVDYVSELDCLVVSSWMVDLKYNSIRKDDCYYIDRQKRLILKDFYSSKFIVTSPKSYAKTIEYVCTGTCLYDLEEVMWNEATLPIFPIAFCGANRYMFIRNYWQFSAFLSQNEVSKRSGPKQNKIDELCKIELSDPKIKDYTVTSGGWYWSRTDVVTIASRVNEEFSVLRWFKKDTLNKISYEIARLFVSKKEVTFCRKNSFGEFIYINGKLSCDNFKANELIMESDDVFKGTKLEYFESCVNEVPDDKKVLLLWLFSYYPIAEKMWKIPEYKYIPYDFVTARSYGKFSDELTRKYGAFDEKAKNVNKALGLNNYQANYMREYYEKSKNIYANPAKILKSALGSIDISYIDNNTFDSLCKLIEKVNLYYYRVKDFMSELLSLYSFQTAVRIANDMDKVKLSRESVRLYGDYISMVHKMNDPAHFKPYFTCEDDIREMHDTAMYFYDLRKNSIKREAFTKQFAKWRKWEYDKNEKFVVIAPKFPNDLAKEGTALHHCVKAYIDRVADGRTNIMFIRKKTDVDEPFFTVEITNDNMIQQVHGFGNRNACTEPGLEEFVEEWSEKCKLKQNSYNKIR